MTATVAAVALPAVATGLWATSASSITWCRFLLGGMDSFVPGQYWITCHFVREVAGTATAGAWGRLGVVCATGERGCTVFFVAVLCDSG